MTPSQLLAMERQLILHEDLRLLPYVDSLGFLTIGVGYNVSARRLAPLERTIGRKVDLTKGITREEALAQLRVDILAAEDAVRKRYAACYDALDPIRQRVLVDMCFNLGGAKFYEFKNTMRAVEQGDYELATVGLLDSKWAKQVGHRSERLAGMMLRGQEYRA